MPADHIVSLLVSLVNMAQKCYPDRTDYVDTVLESARQVVHKLSMAKVEFDTPVGQQLAALLQVPISTYSIITVLQLKHYAPLLEVFDYRYAQLWTVDVN
jgi:hypothetical protein